MDPASRKQREETLEKIMQKESAIATLNEAWFKQKLRLLEFEYVIDDLRYDLEKEKAAVAPISLLPPEILYRIFLCLLEPRQGQSWYDYMKDEPELAESVRSLSLVSKRWQCVIESGPGIWTAGVFHEGGPHVVRVQKWISRSGNLPLHAVLNMRLGNPLRVFLTKHAGNVRSRISSVWIKASPSKRRVRDDDPAICHESLRLLEAAVGLTQLVISAFRFHDEDAMNSLPALRFPVLKLFRTSDSDVPPIEAPRLRVLMISTYSTVCGSHLWNIIVKASRLEKLSLLKTKVLPVWDGHPFPMPELQRLQDLASVFFRQEDLPPCSDQFQLNILDACNPSVLRNADISLTTTFWRYNLDHLPRFTSLRSLCIRLVSNQWPIPGGVHRSMVTLIELLEKTPNLEELRLVGGSTREVIYECDLLVQAFLLHQGPNAAKLCPRLQSVTLSYGMLHWPMILRQLLRDRIGDTDPGAKSTFTLSLCSVGLKHGMKHVPKRERLITFTNIGQTNEKSLQEFEQLMRKTGLGPEPDRLEPVFDILCPKQRLGVLCDLLGHAIVAQTEPEPAVGTDNE